MIDKQNRQTCCGCGIKPPQSPEKERETESSALLSTRFGWRVVRSNDPNGRGEVEWRCPACWEEYREKRNAGLRSSPRRAGTSGSS
jgi:hypothetical protein